MNEELSAPVDNNEQETGRRVAGGGRRAAGGGQAAGEPGKGPHTVLHTAGGRQRVAGRVLAVPVPLQMQRGPAWTW